MKDTPDHTRWSPQAERVERTWLGLITGITAISALAGAIGLITGTLGLNREAVSRLPWHSGLAAGLALVVAVAVPMAVTAALTVRHDARQGRLAELAGGSLIGWISLELAVIRQFSWLQVVFVAAGVVVLFIGRHRTDRHRPVRKSLRQPRNRASTRDLRLPKGTGRACQTHGGDPGPPG